MCGMHSIYTTRALRYDQIGILVVNNFNIKLFTLYVFLIIYKWYSKNNVNYFQRKYGLP